MTRWIPPLAIVLLVIGLAGGFLVNRDDQTRQIGSPCRSAFAKGGFAAVRSDEQCSLQTELIFFNFCSHHPSICPESATRADRLAP